MKTAETINNVCSAFGVTKADLAKRMGILPSSLYRKLARESMTFEEFQKCLDVLGVEIEFSLRYPDGQIQNSQAGYEMLLQRTDILETELEAARKTADFHKKSLKELRTELSSAVGYVELGKSHAPRAVEYLEKIQRALANMDMAITCALGDNPETEPGEEPAEEGSEDMKMLAGKRVLLVDDHQLNREMTKEVLEDHGLMVEEAGDGKKAVEAVKAKEPGYYHFIVMDIEMPFMDGYEATTSIRKLPNRIRANTPIIAFTANAYAENRRKAAEAGMDDFLVKPINSSLLMKSLAKLQ